MSTWCLVTLPNSTEERIEVDPRENARECLEKVCSSLGTLETDYFGLQYVSNRGQHLWLNLRNPIGQQMQGPMPHRLRLRVKFYVQPHFLQQESTREQVYLNVRQDLLEGRLHVQDPHLAAVIGALIAQAELGDADTLTSDLTPSQYPAFLPQMDPSILEMLRTEHLKLAGLAPQTAKYNLIRDVVALVSYGVEHYEVKDASNGQELYMGVGPEGLALYEHGTWTCIKQIEYSAMHQATQHGKSLQLQILEESGSTTTDYHYRLVSEPAASGLYRCVTEMFTFYRCDTVRDAVSVQFIRDLKGTLASLFNENTTLGKKYVFDIQRTIREVYDQARRRLYKMQSTESESGGGSGVCTCDNISIEGASQPCAACLVRNQQHHQQLEDGDTEMVDNSTLCCVCIDEDIDCVFTPCNHCVCCADCAQRLDSCPVCRADIQATQLAAPSQLPWLLGERTSLR